MRAVLQRVTKASVEVDGKTVAQIGRGILALVAFSNADANKAENLEWVARKLLQIRIFENESGKMNLNVCELKGEILVVSNFTLYGELKKGTRPSFHMAADYDTAHNLYSRFVMLLSDMAKDAGVSVKTGVFGAYMKVRIENDGPVTIIIEKN